MSRPLGGHDVEHPRLGPREWLLPLATLLGVAVALRFPYSIEPLGRDQGLFLAQALEWLDGGQFYRDIWEHKPVGVIVLYAGAVGLFGSDPLAVQIAHGLAGFATAAGLFWLGRVRGLDPIAAFAAGVFYLVFFGGPIFGGFWATAQVEVFVDPLVVLALLMLSGGGRNPGQLQRRSFAAGVALGLAIFALKYSCLPLLLLGVLLFLPQDDASNLPEEIDRRKSAPGSGAAAMLLGVGLTAALIVASLGLSGRLEEFWRASVEFNWIHRGISSPGEPPTWLFRLLPFAYPLGALYFLAALGLGLRLRAGLGWQSHDRLWVAALALWVAALAQVFFQGKFWVYHYHVVLLPLVLLAALGFQALSDWLRPRVGAVAALGFCALVAVALGASQLGVLRGYAQDHRLLAYWRGDVPLETVQQTYRWGGDDYDYSDTLRAARRLATEDPREPTLFVWGFEPSLYWLAQRKPVSRFFYDYPLSSRFGDLSEIYRDQLLAELEAEPPATFIVVKRDANDLETADSVSQLAQHPRIVEFLRRNYEPSWSLGDFQAYGRRSDSPLPRR